MTTQRFPYEVFNARNLTPQEIAESFVPPDEFAELWSRNHVILMGPRGSGKTTLLKMLTVPALNSWKHEQAADIRKHIGFTAVYIPTDIHWHHQLLHARDRLGGFPELVERFSQVAVTANVLAALSTSMRYLMKYENPDSPDREATLSEVLIREWMLGPTIPTLAGVNEALKSRINHLYTQIDRLSLRPQPSAETGGYPDYFFLDYLAAASVACSAFDRVFKSDPPRRWALCFDELELAPQWLQDRLFAELRSTDERFIFKLSTSPIPSLISATVASPRHDFSVIRLWPHRQKDTRVFCSRLASMILSKRDYKMTPEQLFGVSMLTKEDEAQYERGSHAWRIMRAWAQHDERFRSVLQKASIPHDDPTTPDIHKRDQVLRKAKPLILLRDTFLKIDSAGRVKRRSRKVPTIYSGETTIYDISEGNPRLLIGIVNDILSEHQRRGSGTQIRPEIQASVLTSTSKQFRALIRSLPEATVVIGQHSVDLDTVLEWIGQYFFHTMVLEPFTLDPSGSFTVDAATPVELHPMLTKAIYHGAIILVDPADDPFDSHLMSKRLRLSYILAPTFRLPLRLYDPVPLSACLTSQFRGEVRQEEFPFTHRR